MIEEKIALKLKEMFLKAGFKVVKVNVVISNRQDLCDYQCNDLFLLAKEYHKSPQQIAQDILDISIDEMFKNISFAFPGFLNITLSDSFINDNLKLINNDKLGVTMPKKELYVMDYGGPNIAKPLHVGHLRTAIVGESIKKILKFMNHDVISDVHLGDYGLQIGQVIYGLQKDNIDINQINIELLNNIYPKISQLCKEDEEIKLKCADITKSLQDGDPVYQKYWQKIVQVSVSDIKEIYNYLNVNFDLYNGESNAYKYLEEVKEILNKKNLLILSEQAQVVEVQKKSDKKKIPPLIFQKNNGAYLYASTDVATIYQRQKDYQPQHILYVVDMRQNLHFEQVFRCVDLADIYPYNALEFIGFGTVNDQDNKPFKTRDGKAPGLRSLLQETKEIFLSKREENKLMSSKDIDIIVNAILKFADLQNSVEKDYIFDLNKFSDVTGKTGPYILYTYLRINKIINTLDIEARIDDKIYNDIDRNLRLKILEVPNIIMNAYIDRRPSYIADYLYDLCSVANNFYATNHVNNADIYVQSNWLYVLKLLNKVIKQLLDLLDIDIPTKM